MIFRKKENNMESIYETDNEEKARAVSENYDDITVVYHSRKKRIQPTLTSIINGIEYTKYNPEYVKYLKERYPGISDEEIRVRINEEVEKIKNEEENVEELEGRTMK